MVISMNTVESNWKEDSEDASRKYYIYLVLFMLWTHEAFHFFRCSVEKAHDLNSK